jgi:hypothetical protein
VKHKKITIAYHTLSLLIEEKEKKDRKTHEQQQNNFKKFLFYVLSPLFNSSDEITITILE